jgi:tRNA(Ile)-lysidine synthase
MENSKNRSTDLISSAIEACLDRHAAPGQTVTVGLSGGVDSVVLLHALRDPARRRNLGLGAVHVHHALSPNAEEWTSHCQKFAATWGIPLAVERVDVERGSFDGLEAAARRARHAAFETVGGDWIALAHHRGDQAETLLFNLLRGTGLAGAAAMKEINGRLMRPLLEVSREDIEAYAVQHGLRWIEDESNADTGFSRNYLRHEILAGIENRFPGSTANLAAAGRRFGEALALLDDLATLDLKGSPADFPLEIGTLKALSEPRARNLLRYLLKRRHIGIPSEERLREVLRQFVNAAPDRHPEATFGRWRLVRRAGSIFVGMLQDDA